MEELIKSELETKIEDKPSPQEIYKKMVNNSKRKAMAIILTVIVAECGLGGAFAYSVYSNNFQTRVVREVQAHHSGSIELSTGKYTGETNFGYFQGEGIFNFNSGSNYEGTWDNNQLTGTGLLNVKSEGSYDGEFINGKKSGKGTYKWNDGSVYEGEWNNDKMEGQGKYTGSTNIIFEGTFKDNSFWSGTCKFANDTGEYLLTYQSGEISTSEIKFADGTLYKGSCDETEISGAGTLSYVSGDEYIGEFSSGKRNGKGVYTWKSKDKYDGAWNNDSMDGSGTYTFANGSYVTGTFNNNIFTDGTYCVKNDFGEYTFTITDEIPKTVEIALSDGTTYSGDITDGKLTGQAQIKYSNGDTYNGKVSDGMKYGNGVYKWGSGASYDGEWNEDKMEGTGSYTYPSGETGYKLTGSFKGGRPNGECQYYESKDTHYKTDWDNGSCVKIYE